jgi:hypothetical protein
MPGRAKSLLAEVEQDRGCHAQRGGSVGEADAPTLTDPGYGPVYQAAFELGKPVQALGNGIRDSGLTRFTNSAVS